MNSLSWFLYIADVAVGLSMMLGIIGFCATFAAIPCIISGKFVPWSRYSYTKQDEWDGLMATRSTIGKVGIRLIIAGPLLMGLATLVPSTKTLYLIAASEAGEAVVTNPDTIEMMGDLKAIIKKRLKEELAE